MFCPRPAKAWFRGRAIQPGMSRGALWPPWSAGKIPWDVSIFPSPQWAHMLPAFPHLGRPLTLALPCIGLDGASHSLVGMGVPFRVEYAFDTNGGLLPALATIHGAGAARFKLGPTAGDILREDVSQWHRVDAVVSGPPCQPDSHQGRRRREMDTRARVLDKVTEIIIDQGYKGALSFIVEMVEGMMDERIQEGTPSHYHQWAAQVAQRGPMWNLQTWHFNTADYLPQHRRRIYTVGTNRCQVLQVPRAPPAPKAPPLQLEDVLAMGPELPRSQEVHLCPAKRNDLRVLIQIHRAKVARTSHGQAFWLTLPLDRDMEQVWGMSGRVDGLVETLRTGDELKWLTHVGGHPEFSRCLHPVERLALQGFPTSLAAVLSKRDAILHTGNAFSVPVVGAVLQAVCAFLCEHGFLASGIPRSVREREFIEAARACRRARVTELHWEIQVLVTRAQRLRRRLDPEA